jgi:hypothetical protein
VSRAVESRAVVTPSLLWLELGGEGDFAPLWLFEQLRRLGYGPLPAGFWWRSDLPVERSQRLAALVEELDDLYPDDERC